MYIYNLYAYYYLLAFPIFCQKPAKLALIQKIWHFHLNSKVFELTILQTNITYMINLLQFQNFLHKKAKKKRGGEGGQKWQKIHDVFYGWPLTRKNIFKCYLLLNRVPNYPQRMPYTIFSCFFSFCYKEKNNLSLSIFCQKLPFLPQNA